MTAVNNNLTNPRSVEIAGPVDTAQTPIPVIFAGGGGGGPVQITAPLGPQLPAAAVAVTPAIAPPSYTFTQSLITRVGGIALGIAASPSKVVRIYKVLITTEALSSETAQVSLARSPTALTGGVVVATPTIVPLSSTNPPASAVPTSYSTAPSSTSAGFLYSSPAIQGGGGGVAIPLVDLEFPFNQQPICTLQPGSTEVFTVTVAALGEFYLTSIWWTESDT